MTMLISFLLDREGDDHRCLRRGDSPPGQQIPGPSASLSAAPDLLCVVDTAEDEIALLIAILEKSKVVDKKTVIILLSCIVDGSRFRKRSFLLEENAKGIEGPVSCPKCPVYKWGPVKPSFNPFFVFLLDPSLQRSQHVRAEVIFVVPGRKPIH